MKKFTINLTQSIASIGKIIILSNFRNILKVENKTNDKCIILGNGPSLTSSLQKYKNEFKNYDLICVNNFVASDIYTEIKPNNYIIAANILFKSENELSSIYVNLRNDIFSKLQEKTNWNLNLMVPFVAKKSSYFQNFLNSNRNIKPIYFNATPIEGIGFINNILFKLGLGMPRPHNIIIPAIMNCIYLNYQKIYIIGADHSWLPEITVNQQNEALINQKHFYDENESKPLKMEDYISRPRRLHEIIHKFYLTFKGYWEIKAYAEHQKVKIYNSSEYSMIDAFEKKEIEKFYN
jgi:hypothetical protein